MRFSMIGILAPSLTVLLFCTCVVTACADDWTVKSIDGTSNSVHLASINDAGEIVGSDGSSLGAITDVRELRSNKPTPPKLSAQSGVVLELVGGGSLAGVTLQMKGDSLQVKLTGEAGAEVFIPLDSVAAVRFSPGKEQPAFQDALKNPSADADQVLAIAEGQLQPLSGLLSNITADAVEFDFKGQTRTLEKAKVFGIVLARSGKPSRYHRLMLTDGSVLPAKSIQLQEDLFVIANSDGESKIPLTDVHRVEFVSERLLFLSDLEPALVREKPLLMLPKPWQRDKGIRGGAIKLGGVEYSKGIGCQPSSRLTFKLAPGAESFHAMVGIDASAKGRGSCIFEVLGDGQSLFKREIHGKDQPVELNIKLDGVEELTLIVEAGEDLDLSDHADWADARILQRAN